MLAAKRRQSILETLKLNSAITVSELCLLLDASEATIRRDLTLLDQQGKLERTHGGALVGETRLNNEEQVSLKEELFPQEKRAIAQLAFTTLEDEDSIILDGGTTTLELAKIIGRSQIRLTIITNSTLVFKELMANDNLEIIMVGGKVRSKTMATAGSLALENLKRFNVEKAYLGTNGLSLDAGLTTTDLDEAMMKTAMIQAAKTRFLLADHSKFNKVYLNTFAPLSMIDVVITDQKTDKTLLKSLMNTYDLEVKQ